MGGVRDFAARADEAGRRAEREVEPLMGRRVPCRGDAVARDGEIAARTSEIARRADGEVEPLVGRCAPGGGDPVAGDREVADISAANACQRTYGDRICDLNLLVDLGRRADAEAAERAGGQQ